jgi:ribosomal protein L7/L12
MEPFLEISLALIALALVGIKIGRRLRPASEQAPLSNQTELDEKLQHPGEIRMLLNNGEKLRAIKLYREETGTGLKEAKQAVDHLIWQMGREQEQARLTILDQGETNSAESLEEVWRLLRARDKIGAIKAYRRATGAGLKEAKEAVERMEAGIPGAEVETSEASETTEASFVDPDKLQRLIRAGRKIEAIKYYREQRRVGLKEAKDAVDWLAANMPAE